MRAALSFRNLIGAAGIALASLPAALHAQQQTLFTWSGRADQMVDVTIRGGSISERLVAASQARGVGRGGRNAATNVSLQSALPQQDGYVSVTTSGNQGASVLQQPTSSNGYTAIVRLGGGNGRGNGGQVVAYWAPSNGNGRYGSNGQYDRNRRNDRDSNVYRNRDRRDRNNGTYGNNNGGYNNGGYNNGGTNNGTYGNNNGTYNNGNGSNVLHWYGDVSGITTLSLRGQQLSIVNAGSGSRNVAGNEAGVTLPNRPVRVSVNIREGRGNVSVVQQPSASNGYTAIVRVTDTPAGYGHYDFDITWR